MTDSRCLQRVFPATYLSPNDTSEPSRKLSLLIYPPQGESAPGIEPEPGDCTELCAGIDILRSVPLEETWRRRHEEDGGIDILRSVPLEETWRRHGGVETLRVVSDFGEEMNLLFNSEKIAIVEFAECADSEGAFLVQSRALPVMDSYKYLGVTLSNGNNYLEEQEKIWEDRAEKVLRQMHARSLWRFNWFEIIKIQWKSTAVSALTYANSQSVTTMSSGLRKRLESLQREAGRWALGEPNSETAIEFTDGALGWSTFEAREAKSKLTYAARISRMSESRWPKAIHTMLEIANVNTKYRTRCKEVKTKFASYEIREMPMTSGISLAAYSQYESENIREMLDKTWQKGMAEKKTLSRYREFKEV